MKYTYNSYNTGNKFFLIIEPPYLKQKKIKFKKIITARIFTHLKNLIVNTFYKIILELSQMKKKVFSL